MKTLALMFGLALLAGCAGAPVAQAPLTITKTTYITFSPPAWLLTCEADPPPGDWTHESGVARYMVALRAVADDCRNMLTALGAAAQVNAAAVQSIPP